MKYFPEVTEITDDQWQLDADLVVASRGYTLFVPKGRQTDLASIPRALWDIIAPFELGLAGPIVHDELYRHGGWIRTGNDGAGQQRFTRPDADAFLNDIMKQDGISAWRRWSAYRAVSLFGKSSWMSTQP